VVRCFKGGVGVLGGDVLGGAKKMRGDWLGGGVGR